MKYLATFPTHATEFTHASQHTRPSIGVLLAPLSNLCLGCRFTVLLSCFIVSSLRLTACPSQFQPSMDIHGLTCPL